MQPKITVALPALNAVKTIENAINSMLVQDYPDFELLVIDDGSTDETAKIVTSFKDSRITLFSDGQRLGLATRLNQAIDMARGQYFARMDADDVSFPERLERQEAFLDSHPEIDLVGCRAVAFQGTGDVIGLLPFAASHSSICARPWRNIPLPHPTWMGRVDWFRLHRYRLPEVLRAEDQDLLLRSYPPSRFACLDEILLGYRQGPFNLRKTLVARRSLLLAQVRIFSERREWRNVLLSYITCLVKIGVDMTAVLPGCDRFYFMRMAEKVPPNIKATLDRLLVNVP